MPLPWISVPPSSSSFTPDQLTGLQVWLKADAIVGKSDGDAISTWTDSSGGSHDLVQGTGGNQPLYKTNIQNGKPSVRFDGSNDYLSGGNLSALFPTAATVFIVFDYDATGSRAFDLLQTRDNDGWWTWEDMMSYSGMFRTTRVAGGPTIALPSGGARVVAIRSDATDWRAWTDGSFLATDSVSSNYNAGDRFNLGSQAGSRPMKGDVFEVIAYNSSLSTTDRQRVEAYLATKWGIDRSQSSGIPSTISGLKLWLKTDAITGKNDGDLVTRWPDSSGMVRDYFAFNNTTSNWPTYKTNIQNSLPAVRFDGSDDGLWAGGNLANDYPTEMTLFIVAAPNADTEYDLLTNVNNTTYWRYTDGDGYLGYSRGNRINNYPTGVPSTGIFLLGLKSSGASYEAYLNGVTEGARGAEYPTVPSGFYFNWSMGAGHSFHGDVFEVLQYDSVLDDTNRGIIESYLNAKWAIF